MTFIGEAESHQAHNIAAYRVGRERRAIDARTIRSVRSDIIVKYFVSPLYKSYPSKRYFFPRYIFFSFVFHPFLSFSFSLFSPFFNFFFFVRSRLVVVLIRTVNLIDRSPAAAGNSIRPGRTIFIHQREFHQRRYSNVWNTVLKTGWKKKKKNCAKRALEKRGFDIF